jgi:spermidine/putrescine transport system substrate-binding protein
MCIPATSRSPGTALLFIDWMLDPENSAQNVMWNGYPQPYEGAREAFASLVEEEPSIDVDLNQLGEGGLEYRLDSPEDRALWNQIWTEVKAT